MAAPTSSTRRPARAPRGRPPAMSDEELREKMFEAAGEMLTEVGGFSLNFEHLDLESITRRANVSRSAVYRVWGTREEFNFDLLKAFASAGAGGVKPFDSETQDIARRVVEEKPELLEDAQGRRTLLLEAVRRATAANFTSILTQRSWRRYAVLTVSADSMTSIADTFDQERGQEILAIMRETEAVFYRKVISFYQGMFALLQLRPKPPFTEDTAYTALAYTTGALFHGLALHHTVNPDLNHTVYAGPGGEWTLPALSFLAILDMVSENAEPTQ